ncbi:galactokinase [Xylanimonas oleitrophica]|uniref:Galactokinase n=1 Tax=Xylanimonas oleitrophica TaxID=2607479 RepID=A0A2W5X3J9_9MICO|nr:galactokinase [Xylanimonas oleitrophica]PZR54975.1 galactokinase [Xylanimonas oleitrophica]
MPETTDGRPAAPLWLPAWTAEEGAQRVRDLFDRTFDGPAPDGVWSAPGRVNVIGEHTDYNAGVCLPTALPHRTYVALRRRDDDVVRIASAQTSEPWRVRLADVAPGAVEGWGSYVAGVAWALREAGHAVGGFDAVVDSCVPFGASLSSSAALECAFAVALDDVFGLGLGGDDAGRTQLVAACIRAENEIAGAATGGLDQSAALLCRAGSALLLDFRPGLAPQEHAVPTPFDLATAGLTLLVIDTRAPHQLVDGQYAARRTSCEQAASILGVPTLRDVTPEGLKDALTALAEHDEDGVLRRRVRHVVTETARAAELAELVRGGLGADGSPDAAVVARAGALMTASHASLRDDYEVTVRETDLSVDTSLAAGAIGARMTGGGFGGSTIALVRADAVEDVAAAVRAAFADAGLAAPAFLQAPPSASAGRDA